MPLLGNLILAGANAPTSGSPFILWQNRVTFTNVSATSSASGYPITNVSNPATDTTNEWRADDTSVQDIEVELNTSDDIDGVGIAGHNFGSAGVSVIIGYLDESDMFVALTDEVFPENDGPLLFSFDGQPIGTLVVRLTASGATEARMAVLSVGTLLRLPRSVDAGADYTGPRFGRKTEVVNGRSERGNYLGRIRVGQWIETALTFKHFDAAWYRSYFDPFVESALEDGAFFLGLQPVDYPSEVLYGWLTDDPPVTTSPATKRISVTLPLGGIAA